MADKWTAPRPDADEVPYWGVNDSFEEEGDDADADLDAEGRKKLTEARRHSSGRTCLHELLEHMRRSL